MERGVRRRRIGGRRADRRADRQARQGRREAPPGGRELRAKGYALEHDDSQPVAPERKAKERKPPKRVFNTPAILATVESDALTINEIAERVGIELTPQLKRRIAWMTERDQVLRRTTTGTGGSKVERFQKVAS